MATTYQDGNHITGRSPFDRRLAIVDISQARSSALRDSEILGRIMSLRAERDDTPSIPHWVELSREIDEEVGRLARLRWEASKRSLGLQSASLDRLIDESEK